MFDTCTHCGSTRRTSAQLSSGLPGITHQPTQNINAVQKPQTFDFSVKLRHKLYKENNAAKTRGNTADLATLTLIAYIQVELSKVELVQ